MSQKEHITQLLNDWSDGDSDALGRLIPLVWNDLHRIAEHFFQREAAHHTLQPTALLSEVYLRLQGRRTVNWKNRSHFFRFAAELMRRVLVDYARSRKAAKRDWGPLRVPFDLVLDRATESDEGLISLHDALAQLEKADARQARIVSLRFFVGLTVEEVAKVLEISPATVKREWYTAKFFLHRRMTD